MAETAAAPAWRFTKRTVEQYEFRGPHFSWAIITLDPRGIFQAVSDFGSYAYEGWGHHGCESFKHFLPQLRDPGYFLGKVCPDGGREFSFDKTMEDLRRRICERRRDGMSKDDARECWDEMEHLEHSRDCTFFVMQMERDCPTIWRRIFDGDGCAASEACRTEYSPGPLQFFTEVFRGQLVPALLAELGVSGA